MIKIEYPAQDFRIREDNGARSIFDNIRKVWLRLSPEEWVRQNIISYLIQVCGYPASMIALEKKLMVGELSRRFDVVVYDSSHRPWMMIECKAMEVPLSPQVLDQVLRYHSGMPVKFLMITNGAFCMGFEKKDIRLEPLAIFPPYE